MNLPDDILDTVVSDLDTKSLLSLSLSCKKLRAHAVPKLYRSLLLVDTRYNTVGESEFTILTTLKFQQFLEALKSNRSLIGLVQRFLIASHSNNVEGLEVLVGLFIAFKLRNIDVPLLGLKEFKILNETTPYKFLFMNKEYVASQNLKRSSTLLYENDEDEFNKYSNFGQANSIVSLQSYQLVNITDLNDVSEDTREICINTSNRYQNVGFMMTKRLSQIFDTLESLEILNSDAVNALFSQLDDECVRFESLNRLSLNIKDLHIMPAVARCVDLAKLEQFELKFKQTSIGEESEHINLNLVKVFQNQLKNLKKLSLVHLNSNNLLKNQSQTSQLLLSNSNLSYCIMEHLDIFSPSIIYLNVSMNNFAYLPPISMNYQDRRTHFVVDQNFLETKVRQFNKILACNCLETLLIPDFFYNWKPFIAINREVKNQPQLNAVEYLYTGCDCHRCIETRQLLSQYSEKLSFGSKDMSSTYNFLVGLLHTRLTKFETSSGLDILKYPVLDPIEVSHYGYLNIDISRMVQLILDNMLEDLHFVVLKLPKLKLLSLGGIQISIQRTENEIKMSAVQDDWSSTLRRST
ncbi:hypothetical protein KL918_000240 [Ogataea parapolymorpha]|uniref:F-box domain-containing protein n=1 Tax=Ogataea parapolymorpha (strain ATCC 26012 / BCRC 20466 / JCM 22074 / NRRL Y-7560 / DL-1) TaxID=871575 RepID=W1Q7F0_OGAPD|nr:hypothetical protein HPODL_02915 [Ogataea parapolymorpha DL-1]ESW96288.1 hypothetical protein HPODL_02915 [Ogataea parapolymorpha DL-1]KAG7870036.1 hypothetical protein KL918_000240 [Ogataea parapolymorpha]KAG7874985.1 hypothetical protein KL916_000597 [Ogataea parapolymorpha]